MSFHLIYSFLCWPDFLVAQMAKRLPVMWETQVRSLNWDNPLEKEMATHSSILAWKAHGQRSLVGYSPWGRWVTSLSFFLAGLYKFEVYTITFDLIYPCKAIITDKKVKIYYQKFNTALGNPFSFPSSQPLIPSFICFLSL